ncbi:hypothetical protein [Lacrimispora algidixylanolytica]|uniref:Uncharacterized protein n=1 Tax=Lacrimispora algidixylanolytica TaxID=94868 RepID=A0A419SRZ5_9FIRM|nr:hypothetical protein [Lacrimispora algidixylanolytica]RKD28077.1 hypothetical protein BET01_11060 [Lacrimispora algidixylanolytica]
MRYSCYVDEYKNEQGRICARLRDKELNKKVSFTGNNVDKNHLLRFLSQAKISQEIMPSIFERDGDDIVAVRGELAIENEDEIVVNIDVEFGGYIFE